VFVHEVDSSGYYHIFIFIPVVEENEQLQTYKVIYICYLNKYYWNDNGVVEEYEQLQMCKVIYICYLNKYYWNDNEW
jgi:hypothetical protein